VRRRARETGVDVERLTSSDPADWIEPDERVAIVEMVDQAREVWAADPDADVALEHLCPAGRFPARLCENRADAIALTEKLTASYRRSVAGWRLAVAERRAGHEVAQEYGLSHVCPPAEDGTRWLAAGRIGAVGNRR
jgi:hypothetical protein